MGIEEKFKSPGVEFRSAPFWSWNDDLQEEELGRQIKEMKEKGIGGFFMHSRIGLITPYLSSEWMDRIKAAISFAKKMGVLAYLYDEDRWPSGFAGGIVPAKGKEYRIKAMRCKLVDGKRKFEVVYGPDSPYFNGYSYVDVLSEKVVEAFLNSTYELYFKEVGDEFGRTVPAVFTDEPNYMTFASRGEIAVPWTDELPARFKERYGYDILEHLSCLFFDEKDYRKVRYDFWNLVTDMFVQAYSRKIYNWCSEHCLAYTGHYLCEDDLSSQIRCIGAAMPHYEYMHIPGVDHLGRNIDNPLTLKQVSSVAHQLGKKRVLSELYGCSGQNFSFAGRKWIGDWHIVLGVNFFCPHLSLYSMRGARKRDFPPTLHYQQPWWKYNKVIEDYFARLNYIMSEGQFQADILVIHPIEGAWCLYKPSDTREVDRLNRSFTALIDRLLQFHRDYDLADEKLLARYGKVEGSSIRVGKMCYKLVVIPPTVSLRATTVSLLREFLASGGKVVAIKPLPYLVEGKNQAEEELKNLFEKAVLIEDDEEKLRKTLDEMLEPEISIRDEKGEEIGSIYYQHRKLDEKRDVYFLVNTSQKKSFKAKVRIRGKGAMEEWNPLNGKVKRLPSSFKENATHLELDFAEIGSHLLIRKKDIEPAPFSLPSYEVVEARTLPDRWQFRRCDPNSLTLDWCEYRLKGEEWSEKLPVWKVQKKMEEMGKELEVDLRFSFQTDFGDEGREIYLVLESPEIFNIRVNSHKVRYSHAGFWHDISFKKIDISNLVRQKGQNTVELSCLFIPPKKKGTLIYRKDGVELESIYIIGEFSVRAGKSFRKGKATFLNDFLLTDEAQEIKQGDLVLQGYPFYAGSALYRQKVELDALSSEERVYLKFEDFQAIVARISVNGKKAGLVFWPPYEVEITSLLKEGENLLEIELTGSLRNLLGPHHHSKGELLSVGPQSFVDEVHWVDGYNFVPFGLNEVKLIRRRSG